MSNNNDSELLKKIDWCAREGLNAFETLSFEDASEISRSALKDILAILALRESEPQAYAHGLGPVGEMRVHTALKGGGMTRIVTTYVNPPIPIRTSDWCACIDGQEEDGPYGWGATEADAIADLKEKLEDAA
jgi:hypothetical protein